MTTKPTNAGSAMAQPEVKTDDQFDLVVQFIRTNSHLKPKLSVLSSKDKGTYEMTSRGDALAVVEKAKATSKNLGMHLADVVDVDIDVKPTSTMTAFERHMAMLDFEAAKFALSRFIPPGVAFGTEARPGSHVFYAYTGDVNELANVKVAGKTRIELRTGEGSHTVMPGSVHPTDGSYHFQPNVDLYSTMPSMDSNQLNTAVSLANAFLDVYRWWESPNRNAVCMGLAGTFWYSNQAAEAAEQSTTPATLDNLVMLVEAVLDYTGDDDKTRVRSIKDTWKKATKGAQVKSLKQEFPDLHSHVMQALRIDEQSQAYMLMRDQFVMLGDSKNVVDLANTKANGDFLNVPFDVFAHNSAHKYIHGTPVSSRLKSDPLTNRVNAVVTRPVPLKQGVKLLSQPPNAADFIHSVETHGTDRHGLDTTTTQRYFNRYAGPPFYPWPDAVTYADVEPGLWFIKDSLASGQYATDPEHRTHLLMAFIADMVQDPAQIPGVAVVLTGIGGTGKTAYTQIAQYMLRSSMCSPTLSLADMMDDKGGADMQGKLLMCIPESSTRGLQSNVKTQVENKLKTLITEDLVRIRVMRENPEHEENYARIILNSNHSDHPVPIDAGATRRYFVITPSEEWSERAIGADLIKVNKVWAATFAWLSKIENKRKLLRFFGDYEYTKRDLRGPHMTPELERLIMERGDTCDEWLLWAVLENKHPAPVTMDGAHEWATNLPARSFVHAVLGERNKAPSSVDITKWPNYLHKDPLYGSYEQWHIAKSRNDKRLANRYRLTRNEFFDKLSSITVEGGTLLSRDSMSLGLYVGETRKVSKYFALADMKTFARYLMTKYPHSDTLQNVIEGDDGPTPTEY
jgi:hypothetical protein